MLRTVARWFLEYCAAENARQCSHPAHEVVADILEGALTNDRTFCRRCCTVQYCRVCGSYRLVLRDITSGWRRPARAYPFDLKVVSSGTL